MERILGQVLRSLYAPENGGASMRAWPSVVRALRRAGPHVSPCDALAQAGLTFEAMLLGQPSSHAPSSALGTAILQTAILQTAIDDEAEALWPLVGRIARGGTASAVEVSLDAPLLPPAFWSLGDLPTRRRPTLAGIGGRAPSPEARAFAHEVGSRLAHAGAALVSGGAEGCDAAFALGHGSATVILPHGIARPRDLSGAAGALSTFAPDGVFSRERAMRRNALIVAAADLTLVAHARLREGGSWHAALGALRRRAPLAVYVGSGEGSGARALLALGALPIQDADEALAALDLVRGLGPNDDLVTEWATLSDGVDERRQPALL